ncbi:MAG: penicillin-binding protein [Clostridiales bacterium]|nr:penicillin-binding protein [Clostridiales bacterium]
MKRTRRRSYSVFIFALLFIIGMFVFIFRWFSDGRSWANMPYNGHYAATGIADGGTITDCYGELLAYSSDGERVYNGREDVRKATLHMVGDTSTNISTSIQSIYRSSISGYNILFGASSFGKLLSNTNMQLTIDSAACATAYNALSGRNGAVVVYNYKTGELLCSVSTPTYDPASPPEISSDDTSYDGVYLDKTLSGLYPPGSTFKIVTLCAALENIPDVEDMTFYCNGSTDIDGHKVTCMDSHGELTLKEAFSHSCNIAFAELSCKLGKETLEKYADSLGITTSYKVNGNPTAKGNFDLDKAIKAEVAWAGIGQYTDEVCPMNMAILSAGVARGGSTIIPHTVKNTSLIDLSAVMSSKSLIKPSTAAKIKDMMRSTVSDYYGDWSFPSLTVCAKTGTAETGNNDEAHGWITGFTLDDDCPLAFACVVENGGLGFYSAGNVVSQTLETIAENMRNGN